MAKIIDRLRTSIPECVSRQASGNTFRRLRLYRSVFRVGVPDSGSQAHARHAGQRVSSSSSGEGSQVRYSHALHLVHGRNYVLPVSRSDIHRPAADVLLPADAGIRLRRHHRSPRAGAARHHARNSPLGRPRDGDRRVAAHVSACS